MTRSKRTLAAAALALVVALAAPGGAGALVIGVGDQTPDMFADPRFVALRIHTARLSVAWDTLTNGAQAKRLDSWLRAARSDGVSPLISFDHSYLRKRFRDLPTPKAFAQAFSRFRRRYPWVVDFATWNEANYCGEPTCHKPALVASYYRVLRGACPHCQLLGAELLDEPDMVPWVRQFDHALGRQPAIWGLHNYLGANRLQTRSTKALLSATTSQIWFTETGGVVARHNHSHADFPQNPEHAAAVTSFVFNKLARLSSRITHVYIYQWDAGPGRKQAWDSGLVGPEPDYHARPAFSAFVHALSSDRASAPTPGVASVVISGASALVGSLFGLTGTMGAPGDGPMGGAVSVFSLKSGALVATRAVAAGQHYVIAVPAGSYRLAGFVSTPAEGATSAAIGVCAPGQATTHGGHEVLVNLACAKPVPVAPPSLGAAPGQQLP